MAYPYLKSGGAVDALGEAKKCFPISFILDSGAFTAWNTGKTITVDEYCRFIDSLPFRPDFAVQLDVFGDPKKTHQNYLIMRKRGYNVMPVFTRGDSIERLEEFYTYTDYIMFGGIVIGSKNREYINWFLNINKGRMCHWLGFVDMDFIKKFKPRSVDSSSLTFAARSGTLSLYKGHGQFHTIQRTKFVKQPKIDRSTLGYSMITDSEINLLNKESAWRGGGALSLELTFRSHMLRSFDVEKNIGTKIYLAINGKLQIKLIEKQYEHYRRNRRIKIAGSI